MCIGVFDSGLGGLHILRSIVRTIPQYDYVYLGDTARAPYGHRSQETIYEYTKQAMDFLFSAGCGMVILACNTASSEALRALQEKFGAKQKILGVLIPAAEEAVQKSKNKRVGIIATTSTVASNKFIRELAKLDPDISVFQQECPLLVPLIEEGEHNSRETETILKKYLAPLLHKKIDTLILGCTHYGILENKIRKIIGPDIAIISEARVVPKKLKIYFEKHSELEKTLRKKSIIHFYSTDGTDSFKILGSKIFGRPIEVKKAILV